MPSLKELNGKIASLRNTQKITGTMKLVAASKLRRAQLAQENAKAYAAHVDALLPRLAAAAGGVRHPLMTSRDPVARVQVVLFCSDRGLCGSFNNNLFKTTANWLGLHGDGKAVTASFCGRRGYLHFRSRVDVAKNYEGVTAAPSYEDAAAIAQDLLAAFLDGDVDEVHLARNRFASTLKQEPVVEKLLPIDAAVPEVTDEDETPAEVADYIFEPNREELLERLLPRAVAFKVFNALLENAAGEHAARMTAMDSATSNAGDLIDQYTLQRNRARQAQITTELTEIITGAESL
jgi:F-type H+-transporting ATPase subunit gamma